jgi:hypothetical protein
MIYIPTKGRIGNQQTLRYLPRGLQEQTILVCPPSEVRWHQRDFPHVRVIEQPEQTMTIAKKRQWIVQSANAAGHHKMVMLDDDLRFAVRREDDPSKFRPAMQTDIEKAFEELFLRLGPEIPHAGFSARGGGISDAAQKGGWQTGKRMMYVLGYYTPTVLMNAELGRISTHEDMDVCLQLLTKGFPNLVNYSFVVDQKFGNPGGCTNERTILQSDADCYQLALWFPEFVRTSEKVYKDSTNRVEVVCQWKKALEYGLQHREQR